MSDIPFHFKNFKVHMDKCAMKVGTDGVLLGAWVKPTTEKNILDIGTGCGLIALMVAQKSNASITAIEIDEKAYLQAKENFSISKWHQRLFAYNTSLQKYKYTSTLKYDLIISNPPFFNHASKPLDEGRIQARHTDQLSFAELIDGVNILLSTNGKFSLILPVNEARDFIDRAQLKGLFCNEVLRIHTKDDKPAKRLLMEFSFKLGLIKDNILILQHQNNSYTKDYIELTKDYYLHIEET